MKVPKTISVNVMSVLVGGSVLVGLGMAGGYIFDPITTTKILVILASMLIVCSLFVVPCALSVFWNKLVVSIFLHNSNVRGTSAQHLLPMIGGVGLVALLETKFMSLVVPWANSHEYINLPGTDTSSIVLLFLISLAVGGFSYFAKLDMDNPSSGRDYI